MHAAEHFAASWILQRLPSARENAYNVACADTLPQGYGRWRARVERRTLSMTETPTATNPLRAGLRMQRTPEPCTVVIFGATGDLTHRKLVPALYNLQRERLLPPGFSVVGFARRDWTDEFFRESLLHNAQEFSRSGIEAPLWE